MLQSISSAIDKGNSAKRLTYRIMAIEPAVFDISRRKIIVDKLLNTRIIDKNRNKPIDTYLS